MTPSFRLLPFAVLLFILPFPGTVALRLLALAAGLVVCAWYCHKAGFPRVPAGYALLLWAGCALASLTTAIDPDYSLGEIKNEIGYAMAAYLGFITVTRTREDAGFFVKALILGSLVLAAFALWEHFSAGTAYWNESGRAGGSGSYSTYLLTLFPALLWAGSVLRHKHRWILISCLVLLQLGVAALVGQRAFWLVFGLQALLGLYLLRSRGFIAISRLWLRAAGVAVVTLCSLAIIGTAATRFTVSLEQDPRVTGWPAIAERILEHPLEGKGFGRQTMKNAYPDLVSQKYPLFWHPHNLFLNYGVAMGIPGTISIALLFFMLLRKFWKLSQDGDRMIAMAGICGVLLVAGAVARNLANDFFQRDLALLFWAIAGMLLGYANRAGEAGMPVQSGGDGNSL